MVRLGITKRSPSTKSSNQRCSLTMRCSAGSNSVMADFPAGRQVHPYRRGVVAAIDSTQFVMPGLVPGIHVFKTARHEKRGWAGQGRAQPRKKCECARTE